MREVDAVNIVTPTSTHKDVARAALEFNCHLFIEKPIMETVGDAEEIIRMAREKENILYIHHYWE